MKIFKFLLFTFFFTIFFLIEKTYVLDIEFRGNFNIQNNELKDLLRLKEKSFISTTEFKSNKLNLDLIAIKSLYKSRGYLDVKIDYLYQYLDKSNVSIEFIIIEGVRYKIRNISILGNKSFEDNYILESIELGSEYYNPLYIRNQLINLKNEYLRIGKINISINEEVVIENQFVDLYIYISEGNKFYVEDILISGLERINQKLVLRELILSI